MATLQVLGGSRVLVAGSADRPVDLRRVKELLAEAHGEDAAWLVVRTEDLAPAFFDLRSGVAGEILQATVVYRLPLAIIGPLPQPAASSSAFAALVRESNRGRDHWFTGSVETLEARFAERG